MAESRRDIPTETPERHSRFLLVVDSDANDLFYLSMLLQRFEYNIGTATNAAEALRMAAVAASTRLITAVAVAEMAGLELVRRLRPEPRTSAARGLINAIERTQETERLCRQAGVAACLYHPVTAEGLYQAVQAAIEPTPRQNIRIHTMLSVTVNGKPLDCVEGECASVLSEHGMYVRTLHPYSKNMRLPGLIVIKGRSIPVETVVLYSH